MGLFDMMMIKDNHIAAAGGIKASVQRADEYIEANGLKVGVGWCHFCAAVAGGPLTLINSSVRHSVSRGLINWMSHTPAGHAGGGRDADSGRSGRDPRDHKVSVTCDRMYRIGRI